MRKFLSLVLVISMIISTITMTNVFVANAAGIDENLVFDLDFSGYVADATSTTDADGLKNAVTGASTDITYVSGMVKGSEVVNEKTINYIDSTNAKDGIDIVNADINSSPDITLETWVKEDEVKNHLFLYGNKTGGIWQFQMCSYNGGWIPQQYSKQNGSVSMELNQWHHLVVTLDRADDSTAATLKVYIDGVEEYNKPFTNGDVYSPTADGTNPPFRISGGSYGSQGCDAKFATVKLYNDIVTAAEAKAKYDAEKANYGIEETVEPENPGTDEPENPGTDEPENPGTDEPGNEEPDIESNPIIFQEDFSGSEYVVGQAPPTNKGLTYWSSGTENDAKDFKVLQTADGDKYVAGVSNTVSKSSQMVYDFDPDISKGPICLELTVKGYEPNSSGEGSGARELLRFYSNNTYKQFGTLGPAAVLSGTSGTKSADGFYHLKLILSKDASDNYVIDFYNKPGSSSYVRTDSSKYMAMKSVQKIMLAHIYPQKEAELGTTGFAISEFKAYYIIIPKITGDTTIDDLAEGDNTVDVKFNTAMDVNSLKAGSYILKQQGPENTIPVSFKAYNEGTKTLTLSLDAALLPDATYNLTVKDIASADGWALNAEDAITVARAKSANLPTSATISAPSIDTEIQANVVLPMGATTSYVFMVFDATGRVKGAKMAEISSGSNTVKVDVASGVASGDKAKLIFWERTGETGFVPVTMTATELIVP